jgi:type III restriction system methylase
VQQQIKSRQRVTEHGEVFTAEREVKAMCDLVKQETERIDSRFLDKTTPRLIQFHTLKNAVNPPFLGGFLISGTVAA